MNAAFREAANQARQKPVQLTQNQEVRIIYINAFADNIRDGVGVGIVGGVVIEHHYLTHVIISSRPPARTSLILFYFTRWISSTAT
jgi:hypothetical protein